MSELRLPAVIVNFKAYAEVEGAGALRLAEACQEVAEQTGVSIVVCPPATSLGEISRVATIPVYAQHVDARRPGAATGRLTTELIRATGAKGSLINHSEHRLLLADIGAVVTMCRENDLTTVVCTDTSATSAGAASLGPDFIAVEPPELIGGNISVTDAQPEVVEHTVKAVQRIDENVRVLCGAGIKTGRDVKRAVELGADGVLLASGVVKAKEPTKALADLVQYL